MDHPPWRPNPPFSSTDHDQNEWQHPLYPPPQKNLRRHLVLFLLTVFTTLVAGAVQARGPGVLLALFSRPDLLLAGVPFSFSLLAILTVHEMGHYVFSRRHGVVTSLPYFIPSPLFFFDLNPGTFGAVIVTKSPYPNRRALMDIGAAGPIAGFLMALPVTAYGISLSEVRLVNMQNGYVNLGEPLILKLLTYLIHGPLPAGYDVLIHPIAFAGWLGFLITMMNLLPIGQLDGGHILYAVTGSSKTSRRLQLGMIVVSFGVLAYLGRSYAGWYVWGGLLIVMGMIFGLRHPMPLDDRTPLDFKRKLIGLCALIILILTFIPVPIELVIPKGIKV